MTNLRSILCLLLVSCFYSSFSQEDTTRVLEELVVKAYQADRPLREVPAAIGVIRSADFLRYNNSSILPSVNTIPGVRMEERSPGSYRFSVRGSLLRSPFGVRNVKMYWNGLPLTDGGGNTYINLLDLNSIGSIEVIKGPGASLYGAGTGGVVLIHDVPPTQSGLQLSVTGGSYGLQRYQAAATVKGRTVSGAANFAHQQSDGYRTQTAMRRNAANVNLDFYLSPKSILSSTIFYSDLFYETPGGLNKAQFEADARQARPATNTLPGAVEQKAAVRNKTIYAGLSHQYDWTQRWSTRTGVYGSYTDFTNAAIFNYEEREESNAGVRLENIYTTGSGDWRSKITFGGEYQYFFSPLRNYGNVQGRRDTLMFDDDLTSQQFLLFAQAEVALPYEMLLTVGASVNFLSYDFLRRYPERTGLHREFDPVISPRIALLKKLTPQWSIFGNVSKGFSPPSLAEVRPSTATFSSTLEAENGISYELGVRGSLLKDQLFLDVTGYTFQLKETIVIRRDENGADYYVNAGDTDQRGIETTVTWHPVNKRNKVFVNDWKIWFSHAYQHYRFDEYIRNNENYSGNRLTGVAPTIVAGGVDVSLRHGIYVNLTANYTDYIPLNDANTEFAEEYWLVVLRTGYKTTIRNRIPIEFFAGVDNLFNETYSLGNDLNAVGGRFYNAAADRNYFGGIRLQTPFSPNK